MGELKEVKWPERNRPLIGKENRHSPVGIIHETYMEGWNNCHDAFMSVIKECIPPPCNGEQGC